MSVAAHLGIAVDEYDARIRTFIPDYEEMIAAAAPAVPRRARTIVDLGVGTGSLAAACLQQARRATIVGIDADAEILALAARRLGRRLQPIRADFLRADLPRADAVVASFALHHVRTRRAKAALYRRVRRVLRPGAVLVTVDCQPSSDPAVAASQRKAWYAHLRRSYAPAKARAFLQAWAREDVYVPLETEIALLERSGLRPDVIWRKGAFAVLRSARS